MSVGVVIQHNTKRIVYKVKNVFGKLIVVNPVINKIMIFLVLIWVYAFGVRVHRYVNLVLMKKFAILKIWVVLQQIKFKEKIVVNVEP